MSRAKLSKEEKAERRRIQQRKYYLKKKAQRMGIKEIQKQPDLMISAEIIQKNWVRIQRTVFSEDVRNYFVQLYRKESMKQVSEKNSNFPAKERSDLLNIQKIKIEPEHDIDGHSELIIDDR